MDDLFSEISRFPRLLLSNQIVERKLTPDGLGGSSDVYCTWSASHKAKVAVKRLRLHMFTDEEVARKVSTPQILVQHVLPLTFRTLPARGT